MPSPASTPASKRQKLSLFDTTRVRNGGGSTDYVTPSSTPGLSPEADDRGSSTEEEDNTEIEEMYLNKMTDDTDRPKTTVFGEGVNVWTSHNGTTYADLNDKVKREQREKELWTSRELKIVEAGVKRKYKEEEVAGKKNKSKKRPAGLDLHGGLTGRQVRLVSNPRPRPPSR
jgi:hypothetical protein